MRETQPIQQRMIHFAPDNGVPHGGMRIDTQNETRPGVIQSDPTTPGTAGEEQPHDASRYHDGIIAPVAATNFQIYQAEGATLHNGHTSTTEVPTAGSSDTRQKISLPQTDTELVQQLEALGITVPGEVGTNKWRKRAQGAFGQFIRDNREAIIGAEKRSAETTVFDPEQDKSSLETVKYLDLAHAVRQSMGEVALRTDIRSTDGPFTYFPDYETEYPHAVIEALGEIFMDYNEAFRPAVTANMEWPTDYQYAITPDGTPINRFVQIDTMGLKPDFLAKASTMNKEELRAALEAQICEIEGSIAGYDILGGMFADENGNSEFRSGFRHALQKLKEETGRPIALLAVTDSKYEAMLGSEFGKQPGEVITDDEVRAISGFDAFFSPEGWKQYLAENGGTSEYLVYVRASASTKKLRERDAAATHKINAVVTEPSLLDDPKERETIKALAITFNVDGPYAGEHAINDTKKYMVEMGLAVEARCVEDLLSPGYRAHIASENKTQAYPGEVYSEELTAYLLKRGADPEQVRTGKVPLRLKPRDGAYGAYGHIRGRITNGELRRDIQASMDEWGEYVVQLEMQAPVVINDQTNETYTVLDRNFMAIVDGKPVFLGGFRSLMPANSQEARSGRNHGGSYTGWAKIKEKQTIAA